MTAQPPRAAVASVQLETGSLNKRCCVAVTAAEAGARSGRQGDGRDRETKPGHMCADISSSESI